MILDKVALFAVLTITLVMIPPAVASVPTANEDAAGGDISGYVIPTLPPGPVGAEVASPLKQLKSGVPSDEIRCRADLVPVQKMGDGAAACVGESAAGNLIERGWASKILAEKPAKQGTVSANEAIPNFVIGDLIKNRYGGDLANIPLNDIPTLRAANEIALAMAHEDSLISESTAQLYDDYYLNGLGVISDGTGPAVYVGIHPSESDREAEILQKLSEMHPDVDFVLEQISLVLDAALDRGIR